MSCRRAPHWGSSNCRFQTSRVLELVLDVEQPHPDRATEDGDRQMHEQERPDADPPHHAGNDERDRAVGRHGAHPW